MTSSCISSSASRWSSIASMLRNVLPLRNNSKLPSFEQAFVESFWFLSTFYCFELNIGLAEWMAGALVCAYGDSLDPFGSFHATAVFEMLFYLFDGCRVLDISDANRLLQDFVFCVDDFLRCFWAVGGRSYLGTVLLGRCGKLIIEEIKWELVIVFWIIQIRRCKPSIN